MFEEPPSAAKAWDLYVRWCSDGLRACLRWPESRVDDWCAQLAALRQRVYPIFFHYPPEYFLADALMPDFNTLTADGIEPHGLKHRVMEALFEGFPADEIRTDPSILDHASAREGIVYHWDEARDRVVGILRQVGLDLPVYCSE